MYAHLEVAKGKSRWFWRHVAANGQILLTSQKYYSKFNAKRAAQKVGEENRLLVKVV